MPKSRLLQIELEMRTELREVHSAVHSARDQMTALFTERDDGGGEVTSDDFIKARGSPQPAFIIGRHCMTECV